MNNNIHRRKIDWIMSIAKSKKAPSTCTDAQILNAISFIDSCMSGMVGFINQSAFALAKSLLSDLYLSRGQTLRQASHDLFETVNSKNAGECPCCQRRLSKYWVTINGGMASSLSLLVQKKDTDGGWVHMPSCDKKIAMSNYSSLLHWGFVEKKPNTEDSTTFSSGFYRATPNGIMFVLGRIDAPRKKQILMGKAVANSEDNVMFADIQTVSFDKSSVYDDDDGE